MSITNLNEKSLHKLEEFVGAAEEWDEDRSSEGEDPTAKNALLALAGLTEAETKGDAE